METSTAEQSARLSIVIVGAGIAGLSTAISSALAGHHVVVLEGAKELAEVGAGFQITPNATRILFEWGFENELQKTWAIPSSCTVHRYDGTVLAHEDKFAENNLLKYDHPFVDAHRVHVQRMLYDKAQELGVEIRLDCRVSDIHQRNNRPTVVQKNGESVDGDLIVGADGLWSRCRENVVGKLDPPLPTGDLAYRIVLTLDQVNDQELSDFVSKPTLHFWIGPGAHAVGYSLNSGKMYNLVLLTPDDLPENVSRQTGSVEEMRGLFKDWDPQLTKILDQVTKVDKWKLMHQPEMQSWSNKEENVLCIGDSAHSMLPYLAQGANSAIEDGAVLGQLLSHVQNKAQLPQAIERFESLRKTRGEMVARETFLQRHDFHLADGPEQEARDEIFRSQFGKQMAEVKFPSRWTCPVVQKWLYGYDAFAEVEESMRESPFV